MSEKGDNTVLDGDRVKSIAAETHLAPCTKTTQQFPTQLPTSLTSVCSLIVNHNKLNKINVLMELTFVALYQVSLLSNLQRSHDPSHDQALEGDYRMAEDGPFPKLRQEPPAGPRSTKL